MNSWIQVTLDFDHPSAPSYGAVHVHWSREDDWSGWVEDEEEEMRKVAKLRKRAMGELKRA